MLLRAAIVGQLMQTAKSVQLKRMKVGHAVANGGIVPRWNATREGRSSLPVQACETMRQQASQLLTNRAIMGPWDRPLACHSS
jgi:hypothetical protein